MLEATPWYRSALIKRLDLLYSDPVRMAALVLGAWWTSNLVVSLLISRDFSTTQVDGSTWQLGFIPVVVNGWHGVVHGISGLAGLLAARRPAWSAAYLGIFALVYIGWGAAGIQADGTVGIFYGDLLGGWVHLIQGTIALVVVTVVGVRNAARERVEG